MSEQVAQTGTSPRRPILDMVQNIRTKVFAPPGPPGAPPGQQRPLMAAVQRFRGPQTTEGFAQLTGSQDFLIGLGIGALAVVVIGALTFEIWAPRVAARLGKAAVTGIVGGLPGAGTKGLIGLGILQLPAAAGRGRRTQILEGQILQGKVLGSIPRPLKSLYAR